MEYLKVHRFFGQGNFVVIFGAIRMDNQNWAIFDIFRVKKRKIFERRDVREQIGPEETWNNSGKSFFHYQAQRSAKWAFRDQPR